MNEEKTKALIKTGVISFFGIGGLLVLYFFPAGGKDFYPVCLTHKLFGLYCPGCGTGRALSCLVHGDIVSAFKFNPLLICSLPFIAYWYLGCVFECFEKKLPYSKPNIYWIMGICGVIILYGILRNLPGWPLELPAPY